MQIPATTCFWCPSGDRLRNRKFRNWLAWTNTLATVTGGNFQLQEQPFCVPRSSPWSGLLCLWGGAWANTYTTFVILYFCLPLNIFHQQSFISKADPEGTVHQELCDFFLLCLQPELLKWLSTCILRHTEQLLCHWHRVQSNLSRLTWLSKGGGIMDGRRTTDNSVLKSHPSCFLHPGEQQSINPLLPRITGWTHQPSTPSLEAAALSKSGGCPGQGQLGRDVEQLLCPHICFGAAPKVPAQIGHPSFVNRLLSTCSES